MSVNKVLAGVWLVLAIVSMFTNDRAGCIGSIIMSELMLQRDLKVGK